jgi:hypothetical protein
MDTKTVLLAITSPTIIKDHITSRKIMTGEIITKEDMVTKRPNTDRYADSISIDIYCIYISKTIS